MKNSRYLFNYILLPVDVLMILVSFALAYYIRVQYEVISIWPFTEYLNFILLFLPLWIIIFALEGLYNIRNPKKGINEILAVVISISTGVALMVVYLFLSKTIFPSRLIFGYSWFLSIFFVLMGRWAITLLQIMLFKNRIGTEKIAIIGNGKLTQELIKTVNNDKSLGMEFIGIIETSEENFEKNKDNMKVLGSIEELYKINTKYKFDTLVLADSNLSESKTSSIFDFCDEKKINFKEIPNLFKVKTSNTIYSTIGGIPIINFRRTPLEGWGSIVKRIFDIFVSIILIIIFSPIMLITALAIKIDSKGPIFFVYKRIGRDGKEFTYFKFRSMVQNAHELRYDPNFRKKVEDTRGWNSDNPMIKYKNDPRITKVGHIIRKYSIDELAEFFLVFIGSMSMVGPRPHEKEEVEKYKKFHKKVLSIKPGITGMGQTSGRSDLTFSDEVGLDIYYIENWSLWLDIKILFKTPIAIFQKRKAL